MPAPVVTRHALERRTLLFPPETHSSGKATPRLLSTHPTLLTLLKASRPRVPQVPLNVKLSAHYRPNPLPQVANGEFILARCHVDVLTAVLAYRLGQQTCCYCRCIPQASFDKNAAYDAPKHAITNVKFKNFLGSTPSIGY